MKSQLVRPRNNRIQEDKQYDCQGSRPSWSYGVGIDRAKAIFQRAARKLGCSVNDLAIETSYKFSVLPSYCKVTPQFSNFFDSTNQWKRLRDNGMSSEDVCAFKLLFSFDAPGWGHEFFLESSNVYVFSVASLSSCGDIDYTYFVVSNNRENLNKFLDGLDRFTTRFLKEFSEKFYIADSPQIMVREKFDWDNLVFPEDIKKYLRDNLKTFLKSKKFYEKEDIPYRRGMLLSGPPGNGKSSVIKALAHEFRQVPFLYYGYGDYSERPSCLNSFFNKMSNLGTCVFILEDIDRVVHGGNIRAILNLLDGLKSFDGLYVIATSNRPERLDDALLERPSRFDQIIHFDHPEPNIRETYFKKFMKDLNGETIQILVQKTKNYSMAMLQEIRVSKAQLMISKEMKDPNKAALEAIKRFEATRKSVKRIKGEKNQDVGFQT